MDIEELKTLSTEFDSKIEEYLRYSHVKVIFFISILLAFTIIVTLLI